ncbi:carbohydrate-binding module family 13 protein [Lyophyllum atratum]|nr:carbohydrate-binding module family 13 protein [Lyophyllum atratum]
MFTTLLALLAAPLLAFAAGAPGDASHNIHPNGDTSKCLDVRGGIFADGTPVQIYDCNHTKAQQWSLYSLTAGDIIAIHGTNFCLDAGSNPVSGVGMKIWTCYTNPKIPAQKWVYTADHRIALEGKGQCLDLTNGVHVNSNQVQTWQCSDNNNNQVWTLSDF